MEKSPAAGPPPNSPNAISQSTLSPTPAITPPGLMLVSPNGDTDSPFFLRDKDANVDATKPPRAGPREQHTSTAAVAGTVFGSQKFRGGKRRNKRGRRDNREFEVKRVEQLQARGGQKSSGGQLAGESQKIRGIQRVGAAQEGIARQIKQGKGGQQARLIEQARGSGKQNKPGRNQSALDASLKSTPQQSKKSNIQPSQRVRYKVLKDADVVELRREIESGLMMNDCETLIFQKKPVNEDYIFLNNGNYVLEQCEKLTRDTRKMLYVVMNNDTPWSDVGIQVPRDIYECVMKSNRREDAKREGEYARRRAIEKDLAQQCLKGMFSNLPGDEESPIVDKALEKNWDLVEVCLPERLRRAVITRIEEQYANYDAALAAWSITKNRGKPAPLSIKNKVRSEMWLEVEGMWKKWGGIHMAGQILSDKRTEDFVKNGDLNYEEDSEAMTAGFEKIREEKGSRMEVDLKDEKQDDGELDDDWVDIWEGCF